MELALKKGELLNLGRSAHKGAVLCTAGSCWLTCEGQPGDHLLHDGQRLQIDSRGTLLLIALHDCRVQIQSAAGRVICPQLCPAG